MGRQTRHDAIADVLTRDEPYHWQVRVAKPLGDWFTE
jgi:hypothetical protein